MAATAKEAKLEVKKPISAFGSEVILGKDGEVVCWKHASLAIAKWHVALECPYLQKKRGAGLNYSFAGEADLIAKIRPSMLLHGLTLSPVGWRLEKDEEYKTAKGSNMRRCVVSIAYRVTHIFSGQTEDVPMGGEASDSGDKAVNKAQTDALKYALRQWLLIETGDDPDETSSQMSEAVDAPADRERAKVVKTIEEAIDKAPSLEMLDKYRVAYKKRELTIEQAIRLDGLYLRKFEEFKSTPPPETSVGQK